MKEELSNQETRKQASPEQQLSGKLAYKLAQAEMKICMLEINLESAMLKIHELESELGKEGED